MTKYSLEFYKSIKKIVNFSLHTLYVPIVTGIENIPEKGPYILAGNHTSLLDIPLLVCSNIEPIRFMAKQELFKYNFSNWFFTKAGAIPVDRNHADIRAIKESLKVLKNNEILGIFPEGTRSKGEIKPFKKGVTLLSEKAKVPIVPFGISGCCKFRGKVYLNFGEPININEIHENSDEYLREKIKKLVIR